MQYFVEQLKLHKSIQPQDLIKMCYQRSFGAKHMLGNEKAALNYLLAEFRETKAEDTVLFENISDRYCRVNLGAWKFNGKNPEDLFNLFRKSAEQHQDIDFSEQLEIARQSAIQIMGTEFAAEFDSFATEYLKNGVRPVHHSAEYSLHEKPAYRIVLRSLL